MRKISDPSKTRFDGAVFDSLSTIRETHFQLRLLTDTSATPALIASQIELYDLLLGEVSGIHASLAKDLKHARRTRHPCGRSGFEYTSRLN